MTTIFTRMLCTIVFFSLSAVKLSAQEQDERWYRVELLIFSRALLAGEEQETWEPTPNLRYPANYRFLLDPLAKANNYSAIDPNQTSALAALPAGQPPRPTPFSLLPASELMFVDEAARMGRTAQYQILFHQSWLHPMVDREFATDIVLDHSGDMQQWPELQGSIKFYLSRYLHVETNLWLNTNGDYLPRGWQMAPPPLGPVSRLSAEPELDIIDDTTRDAGEPAAIDPLFAQSEDFLSTDVIDPNTPPIYPWRHAILLQQERRMRSTEIHYIDHPALGVVIQITPVPEEELLLRADQELLEGQP